jgi:polyisoprenoid-binding protein YceI
MRLALALLVALSLGASSPPVAADVFQIDSASTRADFSVRVAWVRRIEGRFTHVSGQIERDDERPGFDVQVRIDAHSLSMANDGYAAWARSSEFFDAERYPLVQFTAENVREPLLVDGGELRGSLLLRGIERPQVLHIEPAKCGRPGFDCAVMASAELMRSEFGMTGRRMTVADRVRLHLAIRFAE